MYLSRIYQYRFKGISRSARQKTWKAISKYIYNKLDKPQVILDPAAGECDFLNNIPSAEKWGIDINMDFLCKNANPDIHKVVGNCLEMELPTSFFDAVFISNFLEHLETNKQLTQLLGKILDTLKPNGKIAIMGPNFKYSYKNYFDYADHSLILTEKSLAEHLIGVGYDIERIIDKFLPFSFKSRLPKSQLLACLYLKIPIVWKLLGKQFLIIAKKPNNEYS